MGQVFWEASGTYTAKIDPKTLPPLIYQEIVPFQSEYKHSAIIWGIPLLNGFNGSVFLSELFGCHCFTNVRVVSFQTIWFLRGLGNRFTIAVMFGATSSTCLNIFLQPKNGIFQMPDPAGWVSGHTMATWFWINWVFVCLKTIGSYRFIHLPWASISLWTNFNIVIWNLTYSLND